MTPADDNASPWTGIRRRRGKKYSAKREAVLATAATLMRRCGYEGTSLAELADILNITKPTLYYYVNSKEQLFADIVSRAQQEMLETLAAIVEQELTGYEKLRAAMLKYVEIVTSDFGACLLLITPNIGAAVQREIQARSREANAIIYSILEQGGADGSLAVPDQAIVLQTVFGALNWTPRWFRPNGRLTGQQVAKAQVDILLNGLRGPQAPEPAEPARRGRKR